MMAKETAVQKKEETPLSTEVAGILGEYAGSGATFDRSEMVVPILSILQPLSPQVQKGDSRYVDGAEPGNFFISSPPVALDGANLIFLAHAQVVTGWRDRKAGGGFLGAWRPGDEPQETYIAKGEYIRRLKDDPMQTLVDTIQYVALVLDNDEQPVGQAFVIFKSTGLKHARKLNAQIATRKISLPGTDERITPPIWATMFPCSTTSEKNEQGSWYNWKIDTGKLIVDPNLLAMCRDAANDIDHDVFYRASTQQAAAGGEREPGDDSGSADEVPFG